MWASVIPFSFIRNYDYHKKIRHYINNFQNLLPTVRVTPLNLFLASTEIYTELLILICFVIIFRLGYLHSNHQFYVNILIRSRDLKCTLVFLSAMPRSATVQSISAMINNLFFFFFFIKYIR